MFEKGQMYILRGMEKNKRYNAMCDMDGNLYVADSHSWGGARYARFTDGALFLCLEDSPEFDVEAFQRTLDPNLMEYTRNGHTARAKGSYDDHRRVTFLSPQGKRVSMRVKGNKTKFKKVTKRTRVK